MGGRVTELRTVENMGEGGLKKPEKSDILYGRPLNKIDMKKVYMKPTLVLVERKKGYLRPQMALMATSPITHQSTFQSVLYISKAFTEDL